MNDDTNDPAEKSRSEARAEPSPPAGIDLRLIGLVFLLPLALMFVTSIVCIAFVIARH